MKRLPYAGAARLTPVNGIAFNGIKMPRVGQSVMPVSGMERTDCPLYPVSRRCGRAGLNDRNGSLCGGLHRAEVFLIGDRGHGRVNRPVGASPGSVIKKNFVLNRSAGVRFYGH